MRILIPIMAALLTLPLQASETKHGDYLGAKLAEKPEWFKESFLEFEEDVAEARDNGRRVMIYFYQDGCPYCARLVEENFADPATESYIREHFDGITINMWGDREVVSVSGKDFTEKTFAAALKVQFTPTLLFLNEQGKVALRLNGYYPPEKFQKALAYVAERAETRVSFNRFMLDDEPRKPAARSIDTSIFKPTRDLQALVKQTERPIVLYVETQDCSDCQVLHEKVLSDAPTRVLVDQMDNILINPDSDNMLVTPDGRKMTERAYAEELNVGYLPSMVMLDRDGAEVHRLEGFFKTFHVQSSLAYVIERAYESQPSFQRYIAARGEKIRELGYTVDIYGYNSFHPAELQINQ